MSGSKTWTDACTVQAQTLRSYIVQTQRGAVRRNRRHMLPTPVAPESEEVTDDSEVPVDPD